MSAPLEPRRWLDVEHGHDPTPADLDEPAPATDPQADGEQPQALDDPRPADADDVDQSRPAGWWL